MNVNLQISPMRSSKVGCVIGILDFERAFLTFSVTIKKQTYSCGKLGGGSRGLNFYLVLPVPTPSLSGPRLCVLFLLRNIAQYCEIHFQFLPIPAPLGIPSPALSSPASGTLPAPITASSPPPSLSSSTN